MDVANNANENYINFMNGVDELNGNFHDQSSDNVDEGIDCSSRTTSLSFMQFNGRKVLSPPSDWKDAPPSSACELYVRRLPRNMDLQQLIMAFLRFGRIYEMRVPMDFNQWNRGFAYVKYTCEEDAECAMAVLSHYFIHNGKKLQIMHSYEKSRLFVSNIPRHLSEAEVEMKMRELFPTVQRIYSRNTITYTTPPQLQQFNGNNHGFFNIDYGACGDCFCVNNGKLPMVPVAVAMSPSPSSPPSTCQQSVGQATGNRGHVFLQFPSHIHALEAKKYTTPGLIRIWNRDLKVVWAKNDRLPDSKETKTLFVRNVEMMVNNSDIIDMISEFVPRHAIRKVSRVRTTSFFEFTTREAAEICLVQLQGRELKGQHLDIEWAKPSEQQSLHRMRNTDYDAVLRLKCMGNGWQIPIIIFSTCIEEDAVQYCAIMLRNAVNVVRGVFCIMHTADLVDIHSRLCEVACTMIDTIGSFPDYNYVFYVHKNTAHLLGMIMHDVHSVNFIASFDVPHEFYIDINEVLDMGWAIAVLSSISEIALLDAYKHSFRANSPCTYLENLTLLGRRIFGTIMPKYRNKPPLPHNLNNTQIVLVLCSCFTGINTFQPNVLYVPCSVALFEKHYEDLRYVCLNLVPLSLAQSRFQEHYILNSVKYGDLLYYHPAQRINRPPLWIDGWPFLGFLKQPQAPSEQIH